jgi:hypothetical protein
MNRVDETPPETSTTLLEAVIASNPKLTGQIRSIIHYFDDRDICNVPYDNDFIASHPSPTTPTTAVLIATLDERTLFSPLASSEA